MQSGHSGMPGQSVAGQTNNLSQQQVAGKNPFMFIEQALAEAK